MRHFQPTRPAMSWTSASGTRFPYSRGLGVAMPLLKQAHRVILLTVTEGPQPGSHCLADLTRQLAWSGVVVQPKVLSDPSQSVAKQLLDTSREMAADLLVAGGYGHSLFREQVFGGVTRELVDAADLPVFLMH